MSVVEVNFDGIVGPTHNYSGLSYGNIASGLNQYQESNPKKAALQGLEKMHFLAKLGVKQAVLPPQERPHIPSLKALGFSGSDREVLEHAFKDSPELVLAVSSAASMWTANAATVSPSVDSADGLVHLTPANLSAKFHRSIEGETTQVVLKKIFSDPRYFMHHPQLPISSCFSDEGAANHMRFCQDHQFPGVQLFSFGRYGFKENRAAPAVFPARQTYEASRAIARLHGLSKKNTIFVQQNPQAIDAGAFHNDVVSVGNTHLLLYHEEAFLNSDALIAEIQSKVNTKMVFLKVKANQIPLKEAVESYLFNSQLVSLPNREIALIAPMECQRHPLILSYIQEVLASKINQIHFVDVHQSMQNGGGPACLRLRVVLNEKELAATHQGVFLDDVLYEKLKSWICCHYRDRLHPNDFGDYRLLEETTQALDELTGILNLGSIYYFQV